MAETRALLGVGCTRLLFEKGETRASAARVWRFLASDTCTPCQIGHVFGGFPVPNTCTPNWQCLGMHYESKKFSHIVQNSRADALQELKKILYSAGFPAKCTMREKKSFLSCISRLCPYNGVKLKSKK